MAGAESAHPDVVVSDIRMPPHFQREGIEAAKEIRKRHPGTGVVILSQFDDPDYAVSLLSEGSAGYAYLLKDRIAEGDQLSRAIRAVATGSSLLDPVIVAALMNPVRQRRRADRGRGRAARAGRRGPHDQGHRRGVGHHARPTWRAGSSGLFRTLAEGVSAGEAGALDRLRRLHQAIVEREEQGETLSRLLPTGVAERLLAGGRAIGETERLDVTVLMSDIRGYTTIAERADPDGARPAAQPAPGRDEPCHPWLRWNGDAVRGRCCDGRVRSARAESPTTPTGPSTAACAMHAAQDRVNAEWPPTGRHRSGSVSASARARWRPRCSGARSGSSTRSWATP